MQSRKRKNLAIIGSTLFLASGLLPLREAQAETTWKLASGRSNISFSVKHFVLLSVKGRFRQYEGTVVTPDSGDFSSAKVDVSIPVESIYTGNTDRDSHLKQAEFFDSEHFPNMRFQSTKVVANGDGTYSLTGLLTIRKVSKTVTLKVNPTGEKILADGSKRLDFIASGKVYRYDFGLRWNELTETGGMVVDENVAISLEVSLTNAAQTKAADDTITLQRTSLEAK